MIMCAYDWNDSVHAFSENNVSVPLGQSKTLSCKNKDGKCDTYGNGGDTIGNLTVAFCTGTTSNKKEDYCGTLYFKYDTNLFNLGTHVNTTGCNDFDF